MYSPKWRHYCLWGHYGSAASALGAEDAKTTWGVFARGGWGTIIIQRQLSMLRAQACHVWNMSEFSLSMTYKTHLIAMETLEVVEFGKTMSVVSLIPGCFINSCSAISPE